MSELTKTKLNYIFVFLTVSSFLLLNWSIDGLNPAKNAVDLGSMNLDEERLCVGFDEKNFFDIEVNHSSEDLFSVTGKGIFKIGKNNQSNSFSAFATFDPLGKLFGAKLLLHLAGRNLEIELKGAENTEVSIRIKNSMEERTLGVFHLEGPLIFVDMEKLNDNNQASFSFLSTNLLIKNASVRDVRTFIRE